MAVIVEYSYRETPVQLSAKNYPYEAIYGTKPTLSHVRTFEFFVNVPKLKWRDKFRARGKEVIFAGYNRGNWFVVLYQKTGAVAVAQDVEFFSKIKLAIKQHRRIRGSMHWNAWCTVNWPRWGTWECIEANFRLHQYDWSKSIPVWLENYLHGRIDAPLEHIP